MKNLSVNLDEGLDDGFFRQLDLMVKRSLSPCSLDEFMDMEMDLYCRRSSSGCTCHCSSALGASA